MQGSMRLKYEPASEPLHSSVTHLSSNCRFWMLWIHFSRVKRLWGSPAGSGCNGRVLADEQHQRAPAPYDNPLILMFFDTSYHLIIGIDRGYSHVESIHKGFSHIRFWMRWTSTGGRATPTCTAARTLCPSRPPTNTKEPAIRSYHQP